MDQDLVYKEQPLEFGDSDIEPQKLGGLEISPRMQHVYPKPWSPLLMSAVLWGSYSS